MPKSPNFLVICLLLLTGCATAPRVLVQAICPTIPDLGQPAAPEPDYSAQMRNFLRGVLPSETPSPFSLGNAKLLTVPPALR